jgi:hypothetical protein
MPDLPIACSLDASEAAARIALIDALVVEGLLDRAPIASGLRLRFRDSPDIESRVRELIALESQCCAFLDLRLTRAGDLLVLDITGAPDSQPVIEQFFAEV